MEPPGSNDRLMRVWSLTGSFTNRNLTDGGTNQEFVAKGGSTVVDWGLHIHHYIRGKLLLICVSTGSLKHFYTSSKDMTTWLKLWPR